MNTILSNHTLEACGKKYTFTIGGIGYEKGIGNSSKTFSKNGINVNCYGQDSSAIYKDDTNLITSIADGHGEREQGRTISYCLHIPIISKMIEHNEFIIQKLKENKMDDIKQFIKEIYTEQNNYILRHNEEMSSFYSGGSTFTLVHKIIDIDTGDLYTITSNIGDSSHLKIENDSVYEMSESQNCDNIEAVEKYYNHCLTNDVIPSPIILGRFNTLRGFKTPWVGEKPINPYICEIVEGKYKITPNVDMMKSFYEDAPEELKVSSFYNGGVQSLRERPSNLEALANGEYPMKNFGSTVDCSLQVVSSFGDKMSVIKHNIMCVPNINIEKHSSTNNIHDFITSDGALDCLSNDEIIRLFQFKEKKDMSMPDFIKFFEDSIEIQARLGGFKFKGCIPSWDDISYWIINTTVEESYQFRIDKLEKENKLMRELAETLSHQIKAINDILDSV